MNYQEIAQAYAHSGELFQILVGKVLSSNQTLLTSAHADVKSAITKAAVSGYTGGLPVKTARQRKLAIAGMATLENDLSEISSLVKLGRDALTYAFNAQLTRNGSAARRKVLAGDIKAMADTDTVETISGGDVAAAAAADIAADIAAAVIAATDELAAANTALQAQVDALTALIELVRGATSLRAVRALLAV